jgi:trimethylamine:corrinoid methyltransferase-like protein
MGGFTSNVDMRTGSAGLRHAGVRARATLATAQIGRRLRVPVRTSR